MNKIVVPVVLILFAVCNVCAQDIFPSEKDGLWGYVDNRGKWKIQPRYHYAGEFSDGLACVMQYYNHNNSIVKLYGFINEKGKIVIPLEYNYASDFHQGVAVVGKLPGTHWEPPKGWNGGSVTSNLLELQFINRNGQHTEIVDKIHYVEFLPNDTIELYKCVFVSHSNSYRDTKRAYVTKEYYAVKVLRSEITKTFDEAITIDGFLNTPHYIIEKQIDTLNALNACDFKWTPSKDGIIYLPSNQLLSNITETISGNNPKHCRLIPKPHWGMWGFVNDDNAWIIPAMYDWFEEETKGRLEKHLKVHCFSGWGVIDTAGIVKIPAIYDSIYSIDGYFSAIIKDGYTGIVNDAWEIIVPPNKQRSSIRVHRDYNRIFYMVNTGVWHMADTLGNYIQQAYGFDDNWRININNKVIAFKDSTGRYGLMGLDGRIVLGASYDYMFFYDGFVQVKQWASNKEGAVSFDGYVIFPCKYSDINGVGRLIEVVEDNCDTYSKLYNSKGEIMRDADGLPILKKRNSGYNKGNHLMCIHTKNGDLIMTLDGVLITGNYYTNVDWDSKNATFWASRTDYLGNEVIDVFDDTKGKLIETINR